VPTSSERLRSRANAYRKAADIINQAADDTDDPLESEEFYRVAKSLWLEYGRYSNLAKTREEKERDLEHRRKRLTTEES
jgi:hypothetical protein